MDFSTYDYPPYVKNIDGLVGDKNTRRHGLEEHN
jgi:hypothetical protein